MSMLTRFRSTFAAFIVFVAASTPAWATADPHQLLDNFVHYARIAQPDLAEAYAQQLLEAGLSNADLARLLDEGRVTLERYEDAMRRAHSMPELETIAAEIDQRIERGRLDLARDYNRIEQAIEMLTGTQRQRLIGRQRLRAAGEYAVPNLLHRITHAESQTVRIASENMLREIGRLAVTPLSIALFELGDQTAQRIVCEILGDIGYPHAAPYLLDLSMDDATPQVLRDTARRAMDRLDLGAVERDLAGLYVWLGKRYFVDSNVLIAYPHEETSNVWRYEEAIGLTPVAVPTVIYGRIMAMKTSRRALEIDVEHRDGLSLFVASNLKRQNELPENVADPIFGGLVYSPEFYATVFGTQTCLDVLALAIDAQDTQLVRNAIQALSRTTGGANLLTFGEGRQPLLEAIGYPDRRVQYEAALTLARALPLDGFASDYRIVPMLASAVRTGDQQYAVVLSDSAEDRQTIANRLERIGFEIVVSDESMATIRDGIDYAVGIDLAVVRMRSPDLAQTAVEELRMLRRLSVTPLLVFADQMHVPALRLEYRGRRTIQVSRLGLTDDEFHHSVESLMDRASGGRITEAEAEMYAIEALDALRDIAVSRSPVFDIHDAESALLDALATRAGGTRLLVGEILALIDSERSQRSLCDAALAASDFEQVELLRRTANSVKQFGNRLQERHAGALLTMIAQSSGDLAVAAAELYGAMNLPTQAAIRFLP